MACPDNSTECLLRAILDAQSGFDWDPLNFAFTAAIGVLALIVAAITVFQGLLSAGPGRIKASKEAIGPFAKYTKTRFSWTEMRLRTTTKTPFITRWNLVEEKDQYNGDSQVQAYPARWRSLLESADYGIDEGVDLIIVDTDYLPSDIQAAPAWATVRLVMQIAGMAGCNKFTITPGSSYPEARGPNSQLRFREHPDLGGIAIFDQLIRKRIYRKGESGYSEKVLLENMQGVAAYNEPETPYSSFLILEPWYTLVEDGGLLSEETFDNSQRDIDARCESCSHPQCQAYLKLPYDDPLRRRILVPLIARSPLSPRVLKLSSDLYLKTMQDIGKQYVGRGAANRFDDILQRLEGLTKVVLSESLSSVWFQGDEASCFFFSEGRLQKLPFLISRRIMIQMGWSWLYSPAKLSSRFPGYPDLSPFAETSAEDSGPLHFEPFVLVQDCHLVLQNLMDGKLQSFKPETRTEDMRIKLQLQLQLQEIDSWLHRYGGALSICQLRILVMDILTQMEKGQSNTEDSQDSTSQAPPENLPSPTKTATTQATHPEPTAPAHSSRSFPDPEDEEIEEDRTLKAREEGMRALLIFRAAIWTAYIHTAGDISFLDKDGIGDRVVQVL